MNIKRLLSWLLGGIAVVTLGAVLAVFMLAPAGGTLGAPHRVGPPGFVQHGGTTTVWLLTKREERMRRGSSRYHFELHGHDPLTAARRWTRKLLTVRDGGHGAQARLLGRDGDVVWAFLHDQPVALSAADGSVRATGATIAEANRGLAPMWPTALRAFAFDNGLVVTTADALHWRVHVPNWNASAFTVENDDAFRRAQFMSQSWHGGFRTHEFMTRQQTTADGRWIGLYSEREAADAASDGFGDRFKNPDGARDEGATARRQFWRATIGKTREFSEGRHDRVMSLAPVPGTGTYLQGGLLKQPGVRAAIVPGADGGALVLHRDRIDDEGVLMLTRVQSDLRERWTRKLPIAEIGNRWLLDGPRLLLLGSRKARDDDGTRDEEWLVAVDVGDGSLRAWNVERERAP